MQLKNKIKLGLKRKDLHSHSSDNREKSIQYLTWVAQESSSVRLLTGTRQHVPHPAQIPTIPASNTRPDDLRSYDCRAKPCLRTSHRCSASPVLGPLSEEFGCHGVDDTFLAINLKEVRMFAYGNTSTAAPSFATQEHLIEEEGDSSTIIVIQFQLNRVITLGGTDTFLLPQAESPPWICVFACWESSATVVPWFLLEFEFIFNWS